MRFFDVLCSIIRRRLAGEPEAREDVLRMHMLEGNLLDICIAAAAALGSMNPASWPTRLATNLGVAH